MVPKEIQIACAPKAIAPAPPAEARIFRRRILGVKEIERFVVKIMSESKTNSEKNDPHAAPMNPYFGMRKRSRRILQETVRKLMRMSSFLSPGSDEKKSKKY